MSLDSSSETTDVCSRHFISIGDAAIEHRACGSDVPTVLPQAGHYAGSSWRRLCLGSPVLCGVANSVHQTSLPLELFLPNLQIEKLFFPQKRSLNHVCV